MEIPELVRQRLGDEKIESAVNLGDEDVVCFTPTRTLIYRGEGLLSDDSLEVYDHDVERLDVSTGRRKATFTLEYVDRVERFSVASSRVDPVLERLLGGVLGVADVLHEGESILGVYRFSELTLIISEARLVKHIGSYVWDGDYEEFPFSNVTGLEFEEGSVATQFVLSVDGRPRRIKAPNSEAPLMRQTLTQALFTYHDVESLDQLNRLLGERESAADGDDTKPSQSHSDIVLDDSIAPLVTGSDDESDEDEDVEESESATQGILQDPLEGASSADAGTQDASAQEAGVQETRAQATTLDTASEASPATATESQSETASGIDPEEFEALSNQVETLTTAVKRQNELLEMQHNTIRQLIEELRKQR